MTALRDQSIAETRLCALRQHLGSQCAGAFPITDCDFDERNFQQGRRYGGRKLGVAQQFGEHRRRHQHLPVLERFTKKLCSPRRCLLARKATQVLVSAAITGRPSAQPTVSEKLNFPPKFA